MQYKLQCIKCQTAYETDDPDPYLCEACAKEKIEIAKKVDAEFQPSGAPTGGFNEFENMSEERGGTRIDPSTGRKQVFVNAKDLGLL